MKIEKRISVLLKSVTIAALATIFDHIAHLILFGMGEVLLYYLIKFVTTFIGAFVILSLPFKKLWHKVLAIGLIGAGLFGGVLLILYPEIGQGYNNLLHLAHFVVMSIAAYIVLVFKKPQ